MAARFLVGALSAFAVLATAPASARGRQSPSEYAVSVMSWWEIPFRSVVRQQFDFSCGSAAVSTLLTYHYGRPTPEQVAFAKMWQAGDQKLIRKHGFSMLDMKSYLNSIGLHAEGLRLGRDDLSKLDRPAIVLLNLKGFKHFVVVKGVGNDRVLVGDPILGLKQYAAADFVKLWNGIALVVTSENSRAKFNLVSDWSPWSRAPLADGARNLAADNYLTQLPPIYQITPIITIDAHVGTVP